jgi:transposase
MGVRQPMPEGAVERLAPWLKEAHSKAEYQRIHCVWRRATLGLNAREMAKALGWQASAVRHLQARYLRAGEGPLRDQPHGGRYPAHLRRAEEQELRAPFLASAKQGELVMAAPVRQA